MKMALVGDVMLGRVVNAILRYNPPSYPWGNALSVLKQADLRFCNLECVISDKGLPWSKTPKIFHFRSDPKNIEVLKAANINVVSLANNHSLDFGYDAMLDMIGALDKTGIAHVGAGANITLARRPVIVQSGDKKVGFIAFSDNEPDWEASDHTPGIFYVPISVKNPQAQDLFEIVRQTKPKADVIFGHSGHVFRGIEIYQGVELFKNKLIIYCGGNFIDDYVVDMIERNDQSFIFILETADNQFSKLWLYPIIIENFQARLANKRIEVEEIANKMIGLCRKLHTSAAWNSKDKVLKVNLHRRI